MAEFALGLTKMAVEGTVSRVKLAIEEEAKLRVRVENDLVFITGEFQMMQSLLKMANVKGAKNEVVRTWLRQVRDLAFDVEDCIEFVVHLDKKSAWAWLRRLGRMVVSCNAPPLPLDKAVDDIRRLKARVEDVSQRNTRYNLIAGDDSGSGSSSNSKKAVSMQDTPGAAAAAFHTLREVWEVTGKWRSTGDLQKLVMGEGSDLQVIFIWGNTSTGAADLGTASLFSKMYNDPAISGEFRTRAWVKLMHPFNPDEFLECLLSQIHACSHQMDIDADFWKNMKAAVAEEDGLTKAKLMKEVMSKQKYLVVLEGVFSVVEWNVIRLYLPDSENGSRVVVSTRRLEVALLCTGKPYLVSELKHFSDDQSLCAFSKKYGRRCGKGELIWQIRCRGVISVFGDDDIKTTLVNEVYTRIVHKWKQLEGLEFERHSWVDVPNPFNLEVFSRRLLLNLCSEDHVSEEIAAIRAMEGPYLTQQCCKFLHEHDCLVLINGLQSTHDWDLIKAAFLSEPTKGCILVTTNEASVATHCVQEEGAVLNMEDMKADVMLRPLLKASEHCERGGVEPDDRGRPFSVRREQAREWLRQLGRVRCREMGKLELCLRNPGVISLWGASAGKSALVRKQYYELMVGSEASWESGYGKQPINLGFYLQDRTEKFIWVDVPHPFNLTEFSCRLLLDFHSDDHRSKKTAAISMMEEGQDPTEVCCRFLCEYQCLVVIDGIQSTHEWDMIKVSFLSKPMKGHIVVITDEETVATYCVNHEKDRVIKFRSKHLDGAPGPPVEDCRSHLFSNRRGEARNWINKYRLVGHQNESAHRFAGSLSWSGPSVTSVWGIAGIGKSVVVRSVYCHLMLGVEQWLKSRYDGHVLVWSRPDFTMYSWGEVPHPFNLTDLSWRLLRDFYSDDLDARSTAAISIMEGQDPIQECRRFLRQHRCLVVIHGLRSIDHWELIKAAFLPDSTNSCIVVITNEESVARHCVDNKEHQLVNVMGLESDGALDLFKEINRGREELLTADGKELAKSIMAKCGRIPRVVVTIAEMIIKCGEADKDTELKVLNCLNDDFMGSLETGTRYTWLFEEIGLHSFRGLFSWMQSYFDDCSDSLKPCIFYLSTFPAGHNIRRRRLLRRWIAECYSRDTSRSTSEENGEKLISELVNLSIIQHKTSKVLCQLNGFFHEYIISRPLEDNLVFSLEGNCSLNSERAGQHLTIRSSWDRDITVFTSMDLSRLRSLTVFGKWMPFFISTDMRLLRVLDLEDAFGMTVNDLEQIGKVLPRLKFLSIRGCKEIRRLPESLCGLSQLQTLDVRHTSIAMLPPSMVKLKKLQYVRAGTAISSNEYDETAASLPVAVDMATTPLEVGDGTATTLPAQTGDVPTSTLPARSSVSGWLSKFCHTRRLDNGGVKVPAGIGELVALHTLGVVDVNVAAAGKVILKELKKLTQLRKLGVCGVSRENWHDFCSVISGHAHLESLSVQVNKDKEGVYARLDDIAQAPKTLNSLKLYGHVQILPSWIMNHENLKKGNLEMTVVTQEEIDDIENFRCGDIFRRLCVKPTEDGELRVGKLEDGSQRPGWSGKEFRVRVLEIDCSSNLHVTCGRWVFMYVDLLIVRCSSGSSLRVSGLVDLKGLKEVWLKGSYGDELKEDLQRQIDEIPQVRPGREKPVLKPEEAQPHSS